MGRRRLLLRQLLKPKLCEHPINIENLHIPGQKTTNVHWNLGGSHHGGFDIHHFSPFFIILYYEAAWAGS